MITRRRMLGLGGSVVAVAPLLTLAAATEASAAPGYPSYPVAPGARVNVRNGPGTNYSVIDVLPYGAIVTLRCQCEGTTVSGPYGTTGIWDCIGNGRFVSDAYVKTGSDGYVVTQCG